MKRLFAVLILLSSSAFAQFVSSASGTADATVTGAVPGSTLKVVNNGATKFTFTFVVTSNPTFTVQIEGSTNNGTSYSICGSASSTLTANQITCTGTYDHFQANITASTGGTTPQMLWSLTAAQPTIVQTTGTGTVAGSHTNNNAAPGADNINSLNCIANANPPSWVEGDVVFCSVDLNGGQRFRGTLTHNSAVPGANHVGALGYLANAANPTFTEGNEVLGSVDLSGNQRVKVNSALPTGTNVIGHIISDTGSVVAAIVSTPADATSNTGVPGFQVYPMCFNGSTWDRCKGITGQTGLQATGVVNSGTNITDGMSTGVFWTYLNNSGSSQSFGIENLSYNGTTVDRTRTASLANEAPSSGAFTPPLGLQMIEKGPRWTVTNTGVSSGSQGTVSISAASGKRHVVDCIGFSADSAAAVVAANATINVRDGATGAGTVIWFYAVSFPTASALGLQEIPPNSFCGLNLIGTTNTAMTFEFSAGVTGSIQAVNMSGYDIN